MRKYSKSYEQKKALWIKEQIALLSEIYDLSLEVDELENQKRKLRVEKEIARKECNEVREELNLERLKNEVKNKGGNMAQFIAQQNNWKISV